MSKSRSRKHDLLLGAIALITLLQLSFWYQIGSNVVQDLDDCTGGAMSSPHCAEAEIFRQWRAASRNMSQSSPQVEKPPMAVEASLVDSEALLHALFTSTAGPAVLVNDAMQSTGLNTSSEQANASWTSRNHSAEAESTDVRVEGQVRSSEESESSDEQAVAGAKKRLTTLQEESEQRDEQAVAWAQKRLAALEEESEQSDEQAVDWARKRLASLQERFETPKAEHTPQASSSVPQSGLARIYDFGRDFCSQPSRLNHWACLNFWKTHKDRSMSPSNDVGSTVADDSQDPFTTQLSWMDVESWESNFVGHRNLRGSSAPLIVSKQQLKHVSWVGHLPKVACIAVLPSGRDADVQMEYFVQAFLRQDYEGPKQLIIVYHHHDEHARDVVEKHADGVNVLGVRAMGADKDLSTTAYRYGAWTADADVIMRYDFGAWHHPDRISMQVRALAVTKRPASRLLRWTARDYAQGGVAQAPPDGQVQALGEASLTGDKRWMAKNWFPLMTGEHTRLLDLKAFVTNVDMARLLVYNAAV